MTTSPSPRDSACVEAADPQAPDIMRLAAMAENLADTLRTAEALARAARRIDLRGLDQQAGQLCSRLLALPADQARPLVSSLRVLLARLDSLAGAITEAAR